MEWKGPTAGMPISFRWENKSFERIACAALSGFIFLILTGPPELLTPALAQGSGDVRQEEERDYFAKWLKEDVVYIISPEEKAVFERLATLEEKEHFIEQFWSNRDPNPRTSINEFKEEHYRRIAYVNEHFAAGWPGWRTDRGKIYIIHGPPDEIEAYPSGGTYERPLHEGGGTTSVYPFEIWRYRHLDGIGTGVELQFIDRGMSGEYYLALNTDEKDALMMVPNAGLTMAEHLGLATRRERPFFSPSRHGSYPLMNYREQDGAFARYESFVNVQRPPILKFPELKELVDVSVAFDSLDIETRVDYFKLSDEKVLVPVNLLLPQSQLSYAREGDRLVSRVAVYGVVTALNRSIEAEFEDELIATHGLDESPRTDGKRVYQRVLVLDAGKRYRLDLVAKDMVGNRVGVRQQLVLTPNFGADGLAASNLIVSDFIQPLDDPLIREGQMFVLGDVQVRPSFERVFQPSDYCAVYLQLYSVDVDQSSLMPSFEVTYRIRRGERVYYEGRDEVGESVQFFSPQRMVLVKRLSLQALDPGAYEIEVYFRDRIRNESITRVEQVQIRDPLAAFGERAEN